MINEGPPLPVGWTVERNGHFVTECWYYKGYRPDLGQLHQGLTGEETKQETRYLEPVGIIKVVEKKPRETEVTPSDEKPLMRVVYEAPKTPIEPVLTR